jgi:hypothetical protein
MRVSLMPQTPTAPLRLDTRVVARCRRAPAAGFAREERPAATTAFAFIGNDEAIAVGPQ